MLKLLGSTLILGAGAWLRWNTLAQQRRMRRVLEECLAALRRMAEEIRMARTALPLLLERLAGQCGPDVAVLFSGAAAALRRGESLAPSGGLCLRDCRCRLKAGRSWRTWERIYTETRRRCARQFHWRCSGWSSTGRIWKNSRQAEEKRVTALCFSGAALLVILLI